MRRKASVIIVERIPLFGEGLAHVLEQLGAQVVGRCTSLAGGIQYAKTLTPELLILDREVVPQDVAIKDVVHALSAFSPITRVVLVFSEFDELEVRRARRAGVCSCLRKTCRVGTIRRVLKRVLTNHITHSAAIPQRAAMLRRLGDTHLHKKAALAPLTDRELQVCACVARGFSAAQTAEMLGIRPKTVDVHRTRLMAKLGVHDRVTLTRLAIRENLVSPWEE